MTFILFVFVALIYWSIWLQLTANMRRWCAVLAVAGFVANALAPLACVQSLTWFPQYMAALGVPLLACFFVATRKPRRPVKAKVDNQPPTVIEAEFTETKT